MALDLLGTLLSAADLPEASTVVATTLEAYKPAAAASTAGTGITASAIAPIALGAGVIAYNETIGAEKQTEKALETIKSSDMVDKLRLAMNMKNDTLAKSININDNLVSIGAGEKIPTMTPIEAAQSTNKIIENPIKELTAEEKFAIKPLEKIKGETSTLPTINGTDEQITSPIAEPSPLYNETPKTIRDTSEADFQGNRNWELAKKESEEAYKLSLASAGISILEGITNYNTNKKNLKFEKEMTEKQLDTQLTNYETILTDNLNKSFSEIDSVMASKNVDLRSQGITSMKESATENVGKDIENQYTQTKLQKAALNLQYTYNKNQMKSNLINQIIGSGLNIIGTRNKFKGFDEVNSYITAKTPKKKKEV